MFTWSPWSTPSFSISSRERSTTIGVIEFSFRAPGRGTMVSKQEHHADAC
ncbi:hypothetical protein [Streptomyces litmocidini]|nr:hypothetical protein [Streptomyces litmocidini]